MSPDSMSLIPIELKELKQWVNWKYNIINGRKTKVPVMPNGRNAATDDRETWSCFYDVMAALDKYDGIGFVFTSEDPYCGIDYDHVRNGEWNEEILNEIISYNSYAELSPSGEGAHVIVIGEVPGDRHRKGCREMYDSLRFFTMTGNHIPGTPKRINVAQKALNEVYKLIDMQTAGPKKEYTVNNGLALSDEQVISLCMGASNAEKFENLWDGCTSGYDSHSDADLALVSILAFYTQDEMQIESLFAKSGLYRNKWDRDDYRQRTIRKALSGITDTYKPAGQKKKAEATSPEISATIGDIIKHPMQIAASIQASVPIWYDSARNYWMWDSSYMKYARVDETSILCEIIAGLNVADIYKAQIKNEILESIRITGRTRTVKPTPANWIQFLDGVVDINDGNEFIASPEHFFATCIPHKLGEKEDTPTIDTLFENWVGPEKKQLLYEICAYCLYDGYPIHRIFCFVGVGRNGKGQFMTLIRRFIGMENCTSTELDRLATSQFEASKLYKKKAAFVGETNFGIMSRTNMLKALSGGDLISCEFKRADAFDFHNTAKMIIASNSLPPTTDRTEGFYRRWLIIEFNNRFQEGKDIIDTIPEREYENLARKCVRILKELLERGTFTAEGTVEERAAAYEKKSNPVTTFIDDCCNKDENVFCPTWYLFEKYSEFQSRGGHRALTEKEFSTQLRALGYEIVQKAYTHDMKLKYNKNTEVSDDGSDGRSNWRTVFGIEHRCTSKSGIVADVADVALNLPLDITYKKVIGNIATSATCATDDLLIKEVAVFCDYWQKKHKKSITKPDVIGIAFDYCKQTGNGTIPTVTAAIRHIAKIVSTDGEDNET